MISPERPAYPKGVTPTRVPVAPPGGGAPRPVSPGPPPAEAGDGGGGGGWAFLMTATGVIEAELVRGYLESAGVPVALDRRDPSPGAWMFLAGNPRAPVKVFVPAGRLDEARLELLEAGFVGGPSAEPAAEPAPLEPRRRHRLWLLIAILSAIVAAWIVVLQAFGSATCVLRMVC